MTQENKFGSLLERIFSAASAVCFGSILVNALISVLKTKELTNLTTIVGALIVVMVMILNQKGLYAMIGIGFYTLWKFITFFTGGSMTAMWFDLAAAIVLLYLTFLVSRRAATQKDLHIAQLCGWAPGLLSLVGFVFYLSYACNGIKMKYWFYSIENAVENGNRMVLHYIGLELIAVLGITCAGLWTAFNAQKDVAPAVQEAAEQTEPAESAEQVEPAEQTEQAADENKQ